MSIHRQACAFEAYAKKSKSFDEIELQINFCNKILTKSGLPFLRTVCGECALIELVTVAKVVVMCLCLNVFSRFSPEAEKLSLFAVFPLECCFLFGMEGDQAGRVMSHTRCQVTLILWCKNQQSVFVDCCLWTW